MRKPTINMISMHLINTKLPMTSLRATKNLSNTNLIPLNMISKYQNNLENINHLILLFPFKRILLFKPLTRFQKKQL